MCGFRLGVVLIVALSLLLNDAPTSDGRNSIQAQLSTTQTLRSWDGSGLAIPDPSPAVEESRVALKRLGGSRIILRVDSSDMRRDLLAQVQDDVRYVLREARIGYIGLAIRDGSVEVRIRKDEDLPRALTAFGMTPALPDDALGGTAKIRVDGENMVRFTPTDTELDDLLRASIAQSARKITQAFASLGVESPAAVQIGPDRIELLLPGLQTPARLPHHFPKIATVSFHLVPNADESLDKTETLHELKSKAPFRVQKKAVLSGEAVRTASAMLDLRTRKPVITFRFNPRAARRLAQLTQDNVGRPLVIALDGAVIAAPMISELISNGRGRIDGEFTMDEAQELSLFLRAGILFAPLTVVEEEAVVPEKR